MNITAAMGVLDPITVGRLGHDTVARHVALVLACHADYPAGVAYLSSGRIADETGYHRDTVVRALRRLVDVGLIAVEKRPGYPPRVDVGPIQTARGVAVSVVKHDPDRDHKELVDVNRRGRPPLSPRGTGDPLGKEPRHSRRCRCGGTGWVEADETTRAVAPCPGPGLAVLP